MGTGLFLISCVCFALGIANFVLYVRGKLKMNLYAGLLGFIVGAWGMGMLIAVGAV